MYMMLKDIPKECDQINIKRCCSALSVSRSGYYVWIEQDQISDPNSHEMKIKGEIENITLDFPKYGYRRVKVELRRRGLKVNHKVVYDIMKENDLLCRNKRFVPKTSDSEHNPLVIG
jgi:putative transposase